MEEKHEPPKKKPESSKEQEPEDTHELDPADTVYLKK
jgi:hypothetical protein